MTTRQLYEAAIDQRQALEKAGLMAAFDAACGEPVRVERRGRKRKVKVTASYTPGVVTEIRGSGEDKP